MYKLVAKTEFLQLTEYMLLIGMRGEAEQRQLAQPGSVRAIKRMLSQIADRPYQLPAEMLT